MCTAGVNPKDHAGPALHGDKVLFTDMACEALLARLDSLYATEPNWPAERRAIASLIAQATAERPSDLRDIDAARSDDPLWFGTAGMAGYSFYIDHFAGTIAGLRERLPWLEDLGIKLLHPLPITLGQAGDSDGGFAVADYRTVDPALGTVEDVRLLARDLHKRGMSIAIDCVLNHCARDHAWAQAALGGNPIYRNYFRLVEEQSAVDRWEASLDQVFPDTAPGNFTRENELDAWVWTSFYPFQWDLNWSNPAVFREMLGILLFWANIGVDAFRLDSAPYLWKREGSVSRNLPETHLLVSALRAALDLAAPGVVLIAEAIERTVEVLPYLEPADGSRACQLAYHNGLMSALWLAIATRDVVPTATLLAGAALERADTAWLTYLRCHDDIIWSALSGIVPEHEIDRASAFLAGEGDSFANGRRFQARPGAAPSTVGTLASLIGGDGLDAAARYRLLLGTLLALPGMPMLYMGDEIGLSNADADLPYADARWLNRPFMDWDRASAAARAQGPGAPFLMVTRALLAARTGLPAMAADVPARIVAADDGLLLVERISGSHRLLLAANFSVDVRNLPLLDGWDGMLTDASGGTGSARLLPAGTVRWLVPHE